MLKRNPYYRGTRPHHVDGFEVDFRLSPPEAVARVDRGDADWTYTTAGIYFLPDLGLVGKYGINRSAVLRQAGIHPADDLANSARPLFRDNPGLRKAVNFALNRRAIVNGAGGPLASVPSDQYLPPTMPGFRNADVYPLERADLGRARALAGATSVARRPCCTPTAVTAAGVRTARQAAARRDRSRGRGAGLPLHTASAGTSPSSGTPRALGPRTRLWQPSYVDPYAYINQLLDARYVGGTNFTRFLEAYDQQMRQTAHAAEQRPRVRGAGRPPRAGGRSGGRDRRPQGADAGLGARGLHRPRPVLDLTAVCLK